MSAPLTTRGCYICKPDDPSADPEGCSDCDREFFTYVAHVAAALSGDCTDECNPGNCEVQHHEEFAIPEDSCCAATGASLLLPVAASVTARITSSEATHE